MRAWAIINTDVLITAALAGTFTFYLVMRIGLWMFDTDYVESFSAALKSNRENLKRDVTRAVKEAWRKEGRVV